MITEIFTEVNPQTTVNIPANRNAFALLAALTNGSTVRCARCRKLIDYEQVAVLRSRRRRQAIAICRTCAQGGAA